MILLHIDSETVLFTLYMIRFFFCTVRWCVFSTASSGRLSVQRPGDGERRVAHGGDGGDGDPTGVR